MAAYDNELRRLGEGIRDLEDMLKIYDRKTLHSVYGYIQMNPDLVPDPTEAALRGLRWKDLDHSVFERTCSELERFIRENFKMQELQ